MRQKIIGVFGGIGGAAAQVYLALDSLLDIESDAGQSSVRLGRNLRATNI